MALLTYEDAAAWGDTIREVVGERRMPPWFADPKFGKFANDRRLSDEDRQTILTWVEQGCPEGDAKYSPRPREFPEGWRLGKPDLVLTMPVEFAVPATTPRKGIPYKHFTVDPGFTEDHWVVQSEARPGAPAVVHHVVVFIVPPGKKFNPDDPSNLVLGGMAPGDVVVRQQPEADNGDVVVAGIGDGEATVKTFSRRNGRVVLTPANAAYKPMVFDGPEEVTIFGKVVTVVRQLN